MFRYIKAAGESLVALIAIVAVVRWAMYEPVMAYAVPIIGYAALMLAVLVALVQTWRRDRRISRAVGGYFALCVGYAGLIEWSLSISLQQWANGGAYAFGTAGWTVLIVLWERSRIAHKTCPACISKIDSRARVCWHCGREFVTAPQIILPPGVR